MPCPVPSEQSNRTTGGDALILANAVRLPLHALADNLADFLRTVATSGKIEPWSRPSLRERPISGAVHDEAADGQGEARPHAAGLRGDQFLELGEHLGPGRRWQDIGRIEEAGGFPRE